MAEKVPVFTPGQAITRQASAAITGGQLVMVSGPGTVAPSAAASTAVLGMAGFDVASGDQVTVHKGEVLPLVASGAIVAGSPVISAAAGRVAASAAPPAGQQVGIALTTAADGGIVEVAR